MLRNKRLDPRRRLRAAVRAFAVVPVVLALLLVGPNQAVRTEADPPAVPEVFNPPLGDPRLEPIPDHPIFLANVVAFTTDQFGAPHAVKMRFPPRVNGQVESDGDKHADMFVLFDAATGQRIQTVPPILEAVPNGATGPGAVVADLVARKFSSIWELHAVMVDTSLGDPTTIDRQSAIFTSPLVKEIIQTNIFVNCPVVPHGSSVDVGSQHPEDALFEGQHVTIVPYDIEDGGFNVQILYMFKNASGQILGRDQSGNLATRDPSLGESPNFTPHMVASHALGDPFYTSIWDIWTVTVPDGFNFSSITSPQQVTLNGIPQFPIQASGIRLNCPVVEVDGVQVPIEPWLDFLTQGGQFNRSKFPFDVPAARFTKSRSFFITEINPGGAGVPPEEDAPTTGMAALYPLVDPLGKGNVIPLILTNSLEPTNSSGPNSSGDVIRFTQQALEEAAANFTPMLPPDIEANFDFLIANGLLDGQWAAGRRPYQDRLALVGRALFELAKLPHQGANQKDVTTCYACHSAPSFGGAARGLYTLERLTSGRLEIGTQTNAGSMWGSGAAELLNQQLRSAGAAVTFAHGTRGHISTIRGVFVGANNAHFGVQATEGPAGLGDLDRDGVTSELTAGEVTAESVSMLITDVPREGSESLRQALGISSQSVESGRTLFRQASCTVCHVPFHPLRGGTTFTLSNPETGNVLPLAVPHHAATQREVNAGYAAYLGQPGVRLYGDFKLHEMGAAMLANGTTTMKTAELWDVGSVAPLLRRGSLGSDIRAAILAHGGEGDAAKSAFLALSSSGQQDIVNFLRTQVIQNKVGEGSGANFPPNVRLFGAAYNMPGGLIYRATFSMDLVGNPTYGDGQLKYYYSRNRMNLVSTRILDVTVEHDMGDMIAITGEATVNSVPGYRFTAVFFESSRKFGITVLRPDGTIHFTTPPATIAAGTITPGTSSF